MPSTPFSKIKAYQRSDVRVARPLTQVAILLERCGDLLSQALKADTLDRREERFALIDQTLTILETLLYNIDRNSSDTAAELAVFFQRILNWLYQAPFEDTSHICRVAQNHLIQMALIWRRADLGESDPLAV